MKYAKVFFPIGALALLLCAVTWATDPGWPRKITREGGTLVYYPPQVDSWDNYKVLKFRTAFTITPTGGKAVVGAATIEGNTVEDVPNRMVLISNLHVTNTFFPDLDEAKSAEMGELIKTFVPPTVDVSMDRIAAATPKSAPAKAVQLNNSPPAIFVSNTPAIVLGIEGEPRFEPVHNTGLEFVVNTDWHVFRDKSSSQYFLLVDKLWLTSSDLKGTWTKTTKLPADMDKVAQDEAWQDLKGAVPPPAANEPVPTVFYSTVPAEVILFNGQPAYSPIPKTKLTYATNSNSYIFLYTPTKAVYYLTSGRWFSAPSLKGPWTYATETLPEDFRNIPPNSPPGILRAAVPGTDEAKDAVLIAQIPHTATVSSSAASEAKVSYEGQPKFEAIQGTSLSYATNTSQRVIKVNNSYYLCLNGVWFMSSNAQGPWQTAQSVPQEIYSIPPSSPVYNVTYVTQNTTSSGEVQSSYTAGYLGGFVTGTALGAVVAGGTGYWYPPIYGAGLYGYPTYYPYAHAYGATPYYNSATGRFGASQTAYGAYGSATRAASYNPYTGTYARGGAVSTPWGKAGAAQAYNPYTGSYAQTRQGSNAYGSWGKSSVSTQYGSAYAQHQSGARGSEGSIQTSGGGKVGATSTAAGNTVAGKTAGGDMYAGHDGNVYKNTGSGWQTYNNGSWNSVNSQAKQQAQRAEAQRPSGASSFGREGGGSFNTQQMNQELQNRQRGETGANRFQGGERSGGFERGGGGFHGGGRRR